MNVDPLPSTQSSLRLSVTRIWGNRTIPVDSKEWRTLRANVLERDNRTCASCGYTSPHPRGRGLKIDHADGNASNNNPANLRVHCPPCEAIRHCGFAGMKGWLQLASSEMDQVEITHNTHRIFEETGVMPEVSAVDPRALSTEMTAIELANKLLGTDWECLTREEKGLRGFFTHDAADLFAITMYTDPRTALPQEQRLNPSDARANEILAIEQSLPWITFSPESHLTFPKFFAAWRPSATSQADVAWICVRNTRADDGDENSRPDRAVTTWDKICVDRRPSITDLDDLAQQFNIRTGKWLVFAPPADVDALWSRIGNATHAGTLGTAAKVSPRNGNENHVICVYTANYMDNADVDRVRVGLQRLGVKKTITYKPDIYTCCRVYKGNAWGISPVRYSG
ncbi:hypothetical protein BOTBODRAFT_106952 [Botryobasidium botryosum FD-172 SS1]|uniref:HNH nuclease domain-containing protein n=1 Tax=Botryobasidium botryosum (strain FD-172 SS1) TaxID=930990 RepID=A0A067MLK8_BOTB1|nr:hypothetical protein BOTBODRAFT_106952 [Botryobasidium botryosum FD-172 SS1]